MPGREVLAKAAPDWFFARDEQQRILVYSGMALCGLVARWSPARRARRSFSRTSALVRPVTLRRIREPSGLQPSEIALTQVPFAASR